MAVDPKVVHTERQRSIFIERGFRSFDFAQDDIVRDKNKTWVNIFIITPINMKYVLLVLHVSKLPHIADSQNSVS